MEGEIKQSIDIASTDAQYDLQAKRLLSHKIILAHILVKTVDEFYGMKPENVVQYIEGEPLVRQVPIDPGLTNKEANDEKRIIGMNTENAEVNEGKIYYDIIFYVRMKDGIMKIIINIEAQRELPDDYKILNRAIFYVSRLISSQKNRDFVKSNYDDIKRVVSIWICMNMDEDSLNFYQLTNKPVLGNENWEGMQDMISIVMIGLSKVLPEQDERYELHRLLGVLLSTELQPSEKLDIMEDEYNISRSDEKIGEDVSKMRGLGYGYYEAGEKAGMQTGIQTGEKNSKIKIILNMLKDDYSYEQISRIVELPVEEVKEIARKEEALA